MVTHQASRGPWATNAIPHGYNIWKEFLSFHSFVVISLFPDKKIEGLVYDIGQCRVAPKPGLVLLEVRASAQ